MVGYTIIYNYTSLSSKIKDKMTILWIHFVHSLSNPNTWLPSVKLTGPQESWTRQVIIYCDQITSKFTSVLH